MENAPSLFDHFNDFIVETFATTEMVYVAVFCAAYLMVYKYLIKQIEVLD